MPDSPRIFIDGHAGTTGLRIRDWLAGRDDLELVEIAADRRKDLDARQACLERADLAVLCLPDAASAQAVEWLAHSDTRILDASSAHRVAENWVYGLPEIGDERRDAIAAARLVSNAGCYATAVILALRPVLDAGLLGRDCPLSIHALSGYTGAGRAGIERWQDSTLGLRTLPYPAPYSLQARHKHIPEITRECELEHEPQFLPAVGAFPTGMRVEIPIHASLLPTGSSAKAMWEVLTERYSAESFVGVQPILQPGTTDEFSLDPRACNDTNRIDLHVIDHQTGHIALIAILDNLGKGAAGCAIQNLNLMLGVPESRGLSV